MSLIENIGSFFEKLHIVVGTKSIIENLPEEILLKIFAFLEPEDLVRCLQVSKSFRRISKDEGLWQKLKIKNEKIPAKLIFQVLGYGLRQLSIERVHFKEILKYNYFKNDMNDFKHRSQLNETNP